LGPRRRAKRPRARRGAHHGARRAAHGTMSRYWSNAPAEEVLHELARVLRVVREAASPADGEAALLHACRKFGVDLVEFLLRACILARPKQEARYTVLDVVDLPPGEPPAGGEPRARRRACRRGGHAAVRRARAQGFTTPLRVCASPFVPPSRAPSPEPSSPPPPKTIALGAAQTHLINPTHWAPHASAQAPRSS
jgi:hypothetical protein